MSEKKHILKVDVGSYNFLVEGKDLSQVGRVVLVRDYEINHRIYSAVDRVLRQGIQGEGYIISSTESLIGEVERAHGSAEVANLRNFIEESGKTGDCMPLSFARAFQIDRKGNLYAAKSHHHSAYAQCAPLTEPEVSKPASNSGRRKNMDELMMEI